MGAVDDLIRLLAGDDALFALAREVRLRLDLDNPPNPGDLVVLAQGAVLRLVRFDEASCPVGPARIVGVVRRGRAGYRCAALAESAESAESAEIG